MVISELFIKGQYYKRIIGNDHFMTRKQGLQYAHEKTILMHNVVLFSNELTKFIT